LLLNYLNKSKVLFAKIFTAEKRRYAALRRGPLRNAAYLLFSAVKLMILTTSYQLF